MTDVLVCGGSGTMCEEVSVVRQSQSCVLSLGPLARKNICLCLVLLCSRWFEHREAATMKKTLSLLLQRLPLCGCLENVPGLARAAPGADAPLTLILNKLEAEGYSAKPTSLCLSHIFEASRDRMLAQQAAARLLLAVL